MIRIHFRKGGEHDASEVLSMMQEIDTLLDTPVPRDDYIEALQSSKGIWPIEHWGGVLWKFK